MRTNFPTDRLINVRLEITAQLPRVNIRNTGSKRPQPLVRSMRTLRTGRRVENELLRRHKPVESVNRESCALALHTRSKGNSGTVRQCFIKGKLLLLGTWGRKCARVSYLDGTDGGGRQRLQVLRVQKVSRPSSQHFQHLDGKSAGLARRVCGGDAVVHGLLADPLPRRAALPRWIRAFSQDRNRGRCDHDPILVEMAKQFMCGGVFLLLLLLPPQKSNKKATPTRRPIVKSEIRQKEIDGGANRKKDNVLNPQHRRAVCELNPCVLHPPAVALTVWPQVRARTARRLREPWAQEITPPPSGEQHPS